MVVKDAVRLLGIIDEFSVLQNNEIYCSFTEDSNTIIHLENLPAMVVKNPCLHRNKNI
jgi:hypothetical protein